MQEVDINIYLADARNGKKSLFIYEGIELVRVVRDEHPEGYDMPNHHVYLIVHDVYGTEGGYTPVETNNNTKYYRICEDD